MRQVWKFMMPMPGQSVVIDIPTGASFVHADLQYDTIQMWAEVDTESELEPRVFTVVGTGHPIPDGFRHVGTVLDTVFVWHIYVELTRKEQLASLLGGFA